MNIKNIKFTKKKVLIFLVLVLVVIIDFWGWAGWDSYSYVKHGYCKFVRHEVYSDTRPCRPSSSSDFGTVYQCGNDYDKKVCING